MSLTFDIQKSLFLCALLAQAAGATTIIQSSGNSGGTVPIGYYAPYAPNLTPVVYAVGWTQTSDYTDVNVFANLFTPGSPGTADYALVDAIGPGTSAATDVVARGTVTTPTNPTDVDLFHLTSLAAGTYYLVIDSPSPDTGWQYNYPFVGNYTTASGVSFLGDQWAYGALINAGYTPGSNFSGTSLPVEFSVTGTVATPEPATSGGVGMALVGVALLARVAQKRKRSGIAAGPSSAFPVWR